MPSTISFYVLRFRSFDESYFDVFCFMICNILTFCRPEPHILLFRRPLGTDPRTGKVDNALIVPTVEEGTELGA